MTPPDLGERPPSGGTVEGWENWWRNRVMDEIDRLDNNIEALRKDLSSLDKTASVDIRDLQVRAAIWGAGAGVGVSIVVGLILFFIEMKFHSGS